MNAISPIPLPASRAAEAEERRARHLEACREMFEHGMALMRRAAARALAEDEPPPEPAATPAPPEPARRTDPNIAFTRLCRAVRQTMLLECRIAAGEPACAPTAAPHNFAAAASPRRMALKRGLDEASANHPEAARLRRALYERMDHELADDPDETADLETLLVLICKDFGLTPDYSRMPDEILDIYGPAPDTPWTAEEFIENLPFCLPGPKPPT